MKKFTRVAAVSASVLARSGERAAIGASEARLLDLIRGLIADMGLAVVLVTHDLSVARLLSNRILVMKQGEVVESGLTDRVLDDPTARVLGARGMRTPSPNDLLVVEGLDKAFTLHAAKRDCRWFRTSRSRSRVGECVLPAVLPASASLRS